VNASETEKSRGGGEERILNSTLVEFVDVQAVACVLRDVAAGGFLLEENTRREVSPTPRHRFYLSSSLGLDSRGRGRERRRRGKGRHKKGRTQLNLTLNLQKVG
jgi:hypothetical protein